MCGFIKPRIGKKVPSLDLQSSLSSVPLFIPMLHSHLRGLLNSLSTYHLHSHQYISYTLIRRQVLPWRVTVKNNTKMRETRRDVLLFCPPNAKLDLLIHDRWYVLIKNDTYRQAGDIIYLRYPIWVTVVNICCLFWIVDSYTSSLFTFWSSELNKQDKLCLHSRKGESCCT